MRYPLPPLPALHTFEAAARLGSFTAAGQELHLSTSTVSHRIRELEANLGFALFERLPRSLRLTDLGKAYLPVVRAVFDELTMATVGLFGSPAGGRVTLRAPISYGVNFLAPRLPRFTADHDVRVWVVSAIWGDEAADIEVDLEVELSDERLASSGSETLGRERAVMVGNPASPADRRSRVQVLGYEDLWRRLDPPDVADPADVLHLPADVTVDSWAAAIELVAASPLHAALLPELLVASALQTGRVVRLAATSVPMRQTYRLLRPAGSSSSPTPETTAFADWLRAEHQRAGDA